MSIVKQHKEKQEQKHEHFSHYIVHFVNPNMWTLTFNVFLAYQGLLFRDFLWFFFFFSVRPTQYQETHSTVNKERKGGWPNHDKNLICVYKRIAKKIQKLYISEINTPCWKSVITCHLVIFNSFIYFFFSIYFLVKSLDYINSYNKFNLKIMLN